MVHKHDASLTKNQGLVMNTLAKSNAPMSAYSILDELREKGFRAPLQVYRAIDKLLELGMVHRLESLNAFIACRHPSCENHEALVFMICKTCNEVEEVTDKMLSTHLARLSSTNGFSSETSIVELRGTCTGCQ